MAKMVGNDAEASVREVAPYGHPAAPQDDHEANQRRLGQSVIEVRGMEFQMPKSTNAIQRNGLIAPKGYAHIFSPWTTMKWERPNFYRKPGLAYQKLGQHRHRDIFDREWTGDYDDRYISSWDGKVSKLVVQAVDDIYENNTGSTYRRTFIRNVAPMYMRLANWPFNHIDFARNHGNIPNEDLPMLCLKWFVASCFITIFVSTIHPHFDLLADGV